MRNINTWLLFVFLVYLATTGGKENGGKEVEEMEEDDKEDSDGVAVPFPPLDLNSSHGVERASSKLWGVRRDPGANGLLGSQVNIRPTCLILFVIVTSHLIF